jgi:hypothetical protein
VPLVVGDDDGGVLVQGVVLQRREAGVDDLLALLEGNRRFIVPLLCLPPAIDGAPIQLLHLLHHFIERL